MVLFRRKRRGVAGSEASERVLSGHVHARQRTISLDFLDGWIQSHLTISTLMVGVSLALMGLAGLADAEAMAVYDSQAIIKSISWAYLVALSSWAGFLTAGAVFGWSLVLAYCLEVHHIHPEDYDSARAWFNSYSIYFKMFPIVLGLSYIALAIGTASVVSLKILPGVPTTLQIIFAFSALVIFLLFVLYALYRKGQVADLLFEMRKQELAAVNEEREGEIRAQAQAQQSNAFNTSAPAGTVDVAAGGNQRQGTA